jgi:integrase-like protein
MDTPKVRVSLLGKSPDREHYGFGLLVVLKKIESWGLNETARRTKQRYVQVFRHGIGLGRRARHHPRSGIRLGSWMVFDAETVRVIL